MKEKDNQFDVIIIGAGVIGTAIARELTKYQLHIGVVEKGSDVATGTTKANSAIVHAGYDATEGSQKAFFNVKGSELYPKVCQELNVPYKPIGSLVVGFDDDDLETLKSLHVRGITNGVKKLEMIGQEALRNLEPHINPEAQFALYAPTAAITEPWELAIAYMENAMDNGADLFLEHEVLEIIRNEGDYPFTLMTKYDGHLKGFQSKMVVNAAGVFADRVYKMVAEKNTFEIKPRRGQYYLLDKSAGGHVNHVVFPCPSKKGKGTLVLPTAHGNLLIGPDSEDLTSSEREAVNTVTDNLNAIREKADQLIEDIPYGETIRTFSGLRAEPSTGDFIIEESQDFPYFYNVAGIKSPGLSSAPAIGIHVADAVAKRLKASDNTEFNPIRRPRIRCEALTGPERQALIQKDARYGKIICRCEHITEGEIVDAIHRNCGATTVNGVKRRVRPGAGRCQGGFCGPRVVEILARELDRDYLDIELENKGSYLLAEATKAVK